MNTSFLNNSLQNPLDPHCSSTFAKTVFMKGVKWMYYVLWTAGIYNLIWGAVVVLFPNYFFDLFTMNHPVYPMIWQSVGMIVGVYGIGYIIAAYDPFRHWPIVLVGFLGKVFGPIGFAMHLYLGSFPLVFAWITVFNDLIWWVPFGLILWMAYQNGAMRLKPSFS